ncbi:TIGR01777 family oxidoreductase [Rapidithrix thailandica]|uniref:TIGR01777 family oxidoreductase n=1 Tax=Rapidithrix thailandica TaxID=413964 RepID=A0AAW9S2K6_9BACT
MKKIVVAGGSGFLGEVLKKYFKSKYQEIVILSRSTQAPENNIRYVQWDGKSLGSWAETLDGCEVLINLAGKSVDCRYTPRNKQLIYDSRLDSTRVLGEAVQACQCPPQVWINSSSATIYRHAQDRAMDETQGEIGSGFSVDVVKKWEKAFWSVETPQTRKLALRTAIVLGKKLGALQPLKRLTQAGMGGKQGDGNQYFSWIHERDFARVVEYLIQEQNLQGVVNVSAPNPIPNKELMQTMRKIIGAPFGIPLGKNLLELGAKVIQTETELILKSRWVIPRKLQENGFRFHFSDIHAALEDLL